jgi:hypothetical protein
MPPSNWPNAVASRERGKQHREEELDYRAEVQQANPFHRHDRHGWREHVQNIVMKWSPDRYPDWPACSVCGHVCGRKRGIRFLYVHPFHFMRRYAFVCGKRCQRKVTAWEAMGLARKRRALHDWEHQHPDSGFVLMTEGMPAQYPSLSRAVLRAFLTSDMEEATVDGSSPSVLNGTIKRLGFEGKVYAEERSGQTVIRRVPDTAAPVS